MIDDGPDAVVRPGTTLTAEEAIAHLEPRVARWRLPDAVEFIDEVPRTSVGRFSTRTLRAQFGAYPMVEPTSPV